VTGVGDIAEQVLPAFDTEHVGEQESEPLALDVHPRSSLVAQPRIVEAPPSPLRYGHGVDEDFRLETERLRLRPYRRDDLDDLHAMLSDPEHMHWYPAPYDRKESAAWLERQLANYRDRGFGLLIVEDRGTGEFLGSVGPAMMLVEGVEHVEIGWHTRPGRKGEGIAPEAGAASRDWAFENLEVDHLIALVRPENTGSNRVAQKIGMHVDREVDHKGLRHRVYRIDRLTWVGEGGTR
jgi:RimJ/RimL family protein N-acetyltransferase